MKKVLSLMGIVCMLVLGLGMTVFASEQQNSTAKAFLALGADLNEQQKNEVFNLMGISPADLNQYDVVTITNDEEHKYLGSYVDASVIGSNSLSSVMITPAEKGHGVIVTTKNINYCTTGMYRNALLTAGVEDADILVVAPTNISGTAALIGALRAYEEMSGESVPDNTLDVALDELVTTGEIADSVKSASNEDVEALVAFVKEKIASGELETENDIYTAISEGEEKFGVILDEGEKQQIVALMKKIEDLNLDPNKLIDQAVGLYDKYGDDIVNHLEDAGFFDSIGNFFTRLGKSISDFFAGLF